MPLKAMMPKTVDPEPKKTNQRCPIILMPMLPNTAMMAKNQRH
jgi:hypothetical protein